MTKLDAVGKASAPTRGRGRRPRPRVAPRPERRRRNTPVIRQLRGDLGGGWLPFRFALGRNDGRIDSLIFGRRVSEGHRARGGEPSAGLRGGEPEPGWTSRVAPLLESVIAML